MKKSLLFLIGAFAVSALQAQWVNDPATNTKLATATPTAGEIYLRANDASGDTYIQWSDSTSVGRGVNLQRINVNGVPQWGDRGLQINDYQFYSWSPGYALATTSDNGAVTCFRNTDDECIAIKLDKDGNKLWNGQGISVFEFPEGSSGCQRVELLADTDGGVWVLAADLENTYVRRINADGTLNPAITISDADYNCLFGQMVPGNNGTIFVVYKKISPKTSGVSTINNEIWVVSYNIDGTIATLPAQLMASCLFDVQNIHQVIPDGIGGGYVYICHDYYNEQGELEPHNSFVFHFDANGQSTFSAPQGITVHSNDHFYHYVEPYATVDPITHDIILVFCQIDTDTQSESRLYMNRITTTGDVLWDEGILVADHDGLPYTEQTIDTYPNGNGFMVSYNHGTSLGDLHTTIEAVGYDMNGVQTWHTQMNSDKEIKTSALNTTGFHNGQNILVWTNLNDGNIYGQNIDMNGKMGSITSVSENGNVMSASIFQNGNSLIVSSEGLSQVEIISITGQSIKTVKANGNAAEINVSGMTKGLYIVRMNDANGNVVVKKTVIR